MKEFYTDTNFRPASLELIDKIECIMQEYIADGFVLTVRQLYYQLIALIGKSRFSTATCQQSKGS